MSEVFIQLGSNLGNRMQALNKAMDLMHNMLGKPLKISGIYESQAWGNENQENFLNCVVSYKTSMHPLELLKHLKEIEIKIGRVQNTKWGPRLIDLDILMFGKSVFLANDLKIPHPKMSQRAFVMIPLADIAPNLIHPIFGQTISAMKDACTDPLLVKLVNIAS